VTLLPTDPVTAQSRTYDIFLHALFLTLIWCHCHCSLPACEWSTDRWNHYGYTAIQQYSIS